MDVDKGWASLIIRKFHFVSPAVLYCVRSLGSTCPRVVLRKVDHRIFRNVQDL